MIAKSLTYIFVFLFCFGFVVEPKGKAIPDEFNVFVDPLKIDYDLLEKSIAFHVNKYRRKRGMHALEQSDKLKRILSDFADEFKKEDFIKGKADIKRYVQSNYVRSARRKKYFSNWYGVGITQRFGMKYYGGETYFFNKKGDRKKNHFFYGSKSWIESTEDLIRPVHKETYWLLGRSLLQRSLVGARSRAIYKKQTRDWALIARPFYKNSKKRIPRIQFIWLSSTRITDRLRSK